MWQVEVICSCSQLTWSRDSKPECINNLMYCFSKFSSALSNRNYRWKDTTVLLGNSSPVSIKYLTLFSMGILSIFVCPKGILINYIWKVSHTLTDHTPRKFLLIRNIYFVPGILIIALKSLFLEAFILF